LTAETLKLTTLTPRNRKDQVDAEVWVVDAAADSEEEEDAAVDTTVVDTNKDTVVVVGTNREAVDTDSGPTNHRVAMGVDTEANKEGMTRVADTLSRATASRVPDRATAAAMDKVLISPAMDSSHTEDNSPITLELVITLSNNRVETGTVEVTNSSLVIKLARSLHCLSNTV